MKILKILFLGLAISPFFCSHVNCDALDDVANKLTESSAFKKDVYEELKRVKEGIWSLEEISELHEINAALKTAQANSLEDSREMDDARQNLKTFEEKMRRISNSDIDAYFESKENQAALETRAQNAAIASKAILLSGPEIKADFKELEDLQEKSQDDAFLRGKSLQEKKIIANEQLIRRERAMSLLLKKEKGAAFLAKIQTQLGIAEEAFEVLKKNLIKETTKKTPASKTVRFGEVEVGGTTMMPVEVGGTEIMMKPPEKGDPRVYSISDFPPLGAGKGLLLQAEINLLLEQIKANPTDELKQQLQKKEEQLLAKQTFNDYVTLQLQAEKARTESNLRELRSATRKANKLRMKNLQLWENYELSTVPHREKSELPKLPKFADRPPQKKPAIKLKLQAIQRREEQAAENKPSAIQKFKQFLVKFFAKSSPTRARATTSPSRPVFVPADTGTGSRPRAVSTDTGTGSRTGRKPSS